MRVRVQCDGTRSDGYRRIPTASPRVFTAGGGLCAVILPGFWCQRQPPRLVASSKTGGLF